MWTRGKAMVRGASLDRLVQGCLHRRVSPHPITGLEFLKSGKVGKIGMERLFAPAAGGPGAKAPDSKPPESLIQNVTQADILPITSH